MNDHIQKRKKLTLSWDFQKLMECFQVLCFDPISFLDLHWVCPNAHLASKPFESLQPNQFAADWFLVMEAWMARYQLVFYDLDEFYMIFVRCWKWKFDGCTSGFCFGLLKLTLCIYGSWKSFMSFRCFGDVWVIQTTSIWCLWSVRSLTLVRDYKVWKLSF